MSSIVNLYSQLQNARPYGTWSRISNTGPNAPIIYDGPVDFATYSAGTYVYRYTVQVNSVIDTADVSVTWQGVAPTRVNDICDNSKFIPEMSIPGNTVTIADNNVSLCPLYKAPTIPNPIDYPAIWNQGIYTGDLWYYFVPDSRDTIYTVSIKVDSDAYVNAASGFGIQVFTSSTNDCDVKVAIGAQAVAADATSIKFSTLIAPGYAPYIFFRVVSIEPGDFDITVNSTGALTGTTSASRVVKNVYDEDGDGIIIWNLQSDGNISNDIINKFEVYANGKRLEYPAEFTVARFDTEFTHRISIVNPLPMVYYTLISYI